ncbi:MAG: hypothetical protein GY773_22790 [Actinomycetia bacterium]|nr:hypothetical protein [Actinomycetes bacterium]
MTDPTDPHLAATRPPEGDELASTTNDYGDDYDPIIADEECDEIIDGWGPCWWLEYEQQEATAEGRVPPPDHLGRCVR